MGLDKDKIERIKKERDSDNIVTDLMIENAELRARINDLETRVTTLEGGS